MRIVRTALFSLLLALPAFAAGMTLAGVTLPEKVDVKGQSLVLNGMGIRKKLFIKVYVGGLYLGQKEKSAATVLSTDGPRRMVMHFVFGVSKDQMCDAWKEGLELTTAHPTPEVSKAFGTLCTWMEPIKDGNEIVLTYVPGEGTEVQVNGKAKGTLPGKPTADAILNTWLGAKAAPGADFTKAVLGG